MKKIFIGILISLYSSQLFATSFGIFDPRSLAMGNVGVASADASNATYFNPALLSLPQRNGNFAFVFPSINIGYTDPDKLQTAITDYTDAKYETALDNAITTYNASGGTIANPVAFINSASVLSTAAQNLLNGVNTLSNKALNLNLGAGALVAMSNPTLGFSIGYNSRVVGGVQLNIASSDTALIQSYITILACIGNIDTTQSALTIVNAYSACDSNNLIDDTTGDFTNTDTATTLSSTAEARGGIITETNFSFSHQFEGFNYLAIGITPKSLTVTTFDYSLGIDSAEISTSTGQKKYRDTNIDLGVASQFSPEVRAGLVAKNIVPRKYTTVLNNVVKIEPQLRAGIAYHNDYVLAAFDIDLTKNKGLGFEDDSKYAALGLEFDAFDTLQIRTGYRHNTVAKSGTKKGILSAGVGLALAATRLDFAAASNGDELQLGFQFSVKF